MDRAYLDYYITRFTTIGNQQELMARNNALRQSTYPALAINALGDAASPISLKIYKITKWLSVQLMVKLINGMKKVRDWMSDQKDADANFTMLQ